MYIQMTTDSWKDYLVEMDRWAVFLSQPKYEPTPAHMVMILSLALAVQSIPPYATYSGSYSDAIAFNHDLELLYKVEIELGVTVRDIVEQTTGRCLVKIDYGRRCAVNHEYYCPVFWDEVKEENEDEDY